MNILLFTFPAATYSVIKTMSIHTFNYIKLLTRNYDFFHLVLLLYLRLNLVLFYKKYLRILSCHNKLLMRTKIVDDTIFFLHIFSKTTLDYRYIKLISITTLYCK